VTDSSGNQQTQDLLLSVTDVDDTAPNFISGTSVSLDENSGAGELVYQATTDDPDATLVLQGSDRSAFRFDSESGAVTLIANPDYETKSSYEFDMVATDEAGNSQTQTVTLRINDLDEVAPTFLSGTSASIDENSGSNQQVYQTSTNDSSATYSLSGAQSASFSINSSTGAVSLLENPNYESRSSYSFSVIAEDSAGNRSERSVTLSVNNLDEIAPEFTSGTTATSVNENSGAGVLVYTAVVDDSADTSSGVTFSLAGSHASAFEIDSSSGEVRLRADANYESLSNYSFSVIATDAAGNQSSQPVSMAVNNLDEEAPAFTSSATADAIDENSGGGSVVYRATTSDDADISAGVTYTLSGTHADYFTIDGASGAVTLKEDANYEDLSSYQFVVIAEDVAGNSQDLTVTLAVTNLDEVAPVFTSGTTATDTSENSTVGTLVYTAIVDDSQDVSAGVTYELSGSDADAFQIDANGAVTLAESPDFETQPGYSFVITATDGAGLQVQQSVSLTILDVDEIPPVVTSTPDNLVVDDGAGAGDTVYQAQSSEDGVSYGLEGGDSAYFDIDPETGAITLLDDADFDSQSEFTFTVLVTDEAGNVTRQPVTITINNVAPTITSGTELTAVDENTGAGEQVYQATSNDAQATFGLSGADQAYFEIDSETGVVTLLADADHETKSSYSFTVTATDTTNLVGSLNLTLNVNDIDEIAPQFADTGSRSGGFVSVWVSDGQDGDAAGVYAQLFDADGLLSGSEFLVNSYTTSSQWQPAVTSLVSGGFVVVWSSEGQDGSGSGLYARLYDEAGVAADVEFLVNATVAGDQQLASVTALSDGGFVVVWQTTGQDADGLAIYAQRYDSDGNASGSEFQVNQTEVADQSGPQVTALADGGYAVSWVSDGQDGDSAGVYVQSYRANGNVAVAETRVNTYTAGSQSSVELTGLTFGGFVVAWVSDAQDGSGSGVYFQRFNSSGYSVGSETLVNETTTGNQSEVTITALADGGFVVVWNSDDAGSEGIYARIYDSDGEAQSDEFQVDSGAATTVSDPEVTWLADGGFIISWQSVGQDGDGSGVYAQRFAANGNQVGLEYQVNTSTTGDQTSTDLSSLVDNHTTTIRIDEGTGAGEVIYIPYLIDTADIDDDTDTTDELVYSPSGPDRAYFDIDPDTGYVTLLENADYETRSSYSFTVTAKDPAGESADHDVVLSVRDIEERDVIIDLVSGVSSLDTDGDRVFNDDMTYNIYILVDSDSANLTLATGQNWLSGQNLGADDTIYLVGDGSTVASDSGDPVSAIGTVLESGEGDNLWWGASESDLAVSIDARVITRYYGGNTDDVIWYLGGDWAEGDTPNSGQDVSLVSLDSLPARVEEELNWS
ncbi:MAG: cadherin domain-containing protein, partial [Oceanobacter sp.]